MIRASHLAKGLDSDVSCQLCLNMHSDTWYHSVPSEQGSVVSMVLQLGLQQQLVQWLQIRVHHQWLRQ